eukprot:scaffold1318_cov388-Prasinococcus_capsulatus_cf.AAC.53
MRGGGLFRARGRGRGRRRGRGRGRGRVASGAVGEGPTTLATAKQRPHRPLAHAAPGRRGRRPQQPPGARRAQRETRIARPPSSSGCCGACSQRRTRISSSPDGRRELGEAPLRPCSLLLEPRAAHVQLALAAGKADCSHRNGEGEGEEVAAASDAAHHADEGGGCVAPSPPVVGGGGESPFRPRGRRALATMMLRAAYADAGRRLRLGKRRRWRRARVVLLIAALLACVAYYRARRKTWPGQLASSSATRSSSDSHYVAFETPSEELGLLAFPRVRPRPPKLVQLSAGAPPPPELHRQPGVLPHKQAAPAAGGGAAATGWLAEGLKNDAAARRAAAAEVCITIAASGRDSLELVGTWVVGANSAGCVGRLLRRALLDAFASASTEFLGLPAHMGVSRC